MAFRATRCAPISSPAGRAPARRRRSAPASFRFRSAPTPRDRGACRRRSTASSASSPRSAPSPRPASSPPAARSTPCRSSRSTPPTRSRSFAPRTDTTSATPIRASFRRRRCQACPKASDSAFRAPISGCSSATRRRRRRSPAISKPRERWAPAWSNSISSRSPRSRGCSTKVRGSPSATPRPSR